MSYKCISIDEAKALIDEKELTLVDVRDPRSFSENHIQNSINVLDYNLEDFLSNAKKDQPLIVYCYHGNSSQGAAGFFCENGFKEVYSMNGDFEAWRLKYS